MDEQESRQLEVMVASPLPVLRGQRARSWERRRLPRSVTYQVYVVDFATTFGRLCFVLSTAIMGLVVLAFWDRPGVGERWPLLVLACLLLGLVGAGAGGAVALWVRAGEFNTYMEELENVTLEPQAEVADAPAPGRTYRVTIPGGDGRVASFLQPKSGEFANWLAAVLRDHDDDDLRPYEKTTLSQNTGTRRGWPREMYKDMLAQVVMMGWFVEGANRVPEPTREGKRALGAWLRNAPPAPVFR